MVEPGLVSLLLSLFELVKGNAAWDAIKLVSRFVTARDDAVPAAIESAPHTADRPYLQVWTRQAQFTSQLLNLFREGVGGDKFVADAMPSWNAIYAGDRDSREVLRDFYERLQGRVARSDAGLADVITRMENQFGALRADLRRLASTLATRDDLIIKLATLARMNPGEQSDTELRRLGDQIGMLVVATDPLSFYRAHLLTDRHLPEHIPALLEAELRLRQVQERSGIPGEGKAAATLGYPKAYPRR